MQGWRSGLVVALVLFGAGPAARATRLAPAAGPVVAELFTSEGCSSCPPADAVLREIADAHLVSDVDVIALGEHVDYWDHLGWRDAFSDVAFSRRQSDYDTRAFHTGSIYTPQLVVDGQRQVVGSDRRQVVAAIREAAARPKAALSVRVSAATAADLPVEVTVSARPAGRRAVDADVVLFLTEDHLTTAVLRGENGGRRLEHAAVVRSMVVAGRLEAAAAGGLFRAGLPWRTGWDLRRASVVVLLQERASRQVIGAARVAVGGGGRLVSEP